jgi:hypothetical protein
LKRRGLSLTDFKLVLEKLISAFAGQEKMKLSKKAEKELIRFAMSGDFQRDMEVLNRRHTSPFVRDGKVDIDSYIEFIMQFNAFINHAHKPFTGIIDMGMRL